ncbi:MAG: exodeoxyribonuclease I [Sphaerochaetaceae bacterium]|jgi:exodeoxyribonuclease-1|nr:exodeoxyribonuclease I [Sphaerochaetaceae bacterium]MDD4763245.1 exodeoxyribonuclease I [Sphaerochaetaceae bacterium]MDX9933617.1 exodeoxyribonuclease I [Sphaerochaetaceae bacterium]NLO60518.1 exodeoxyribonuclease I [Spirochaetales bacterium]
MITEETFFWYDLETFGLDPRYDRIAQFAGIRTTMNLQQIGDPEVLYCRLSDDYLPDPLACLVTRITPQEVEEKGLCESEFIGKINDLFSVPGTCAVGFNSIRFDDEFIRNTLFRNFIDPYKREYKNGNSRWDIIDLVRAAYDLRPEGINWPKSKESGKPSFTLIDLMEANGFDNEHAHDALNDVHATMKIARLIREKQPKLFDYFFELRDKHQVHAMLKVPFGEPVLHTAAQYTSTQGCSALVAPIASLERNADSIIAFNLSKDPTALIEWANSFSEAEEALFVAASARSLLAETTTDNEMSTMLDRCTTTIERLAKAFGSAKRPVYAIDGITKIAANRSPFISPMSVLTDKISTRLGIDVQQCMRNYEKLLELPMLAVRVRSDAEQNQYPVIRDVDGSIYSGNFFSDADQRRFVQIRTTEPEKLWDLNLNFDDNRAHEMLWRYICRNYRETVGKEPDEVERWKSFCAWRLLKPPVDSLLSLEKFHKIIDGKLADMDVKAADKEILLQLEQWANGLRKRIGL